MIKNKMHNKEMKEYKCDSKSWANKDSDFLIHVIKTRFIEPTYIVVVECPYDTIAETTDILFGKELSKKYGIEPW